MNNYIVLALLIGIAILGLIFAAVAFYRQKDLPKRDPGYRAFFILGVSFLPIGIATDNPGFWGMGAVFLILGLASRDKWKDKPKWSELEPERRRIKFILIGLLTLAFLTLLMFYIFVKSN